MANSGLPSSRKTKADRRSSRASRLSSPSLRATAQDAFKGRSTDPRKARLYWIEGSLLGNLGVTRHAERRSRKARSCFLELKALVDFVLVSLDLARFLFAEGSAEAARHLGTATLKELGELEDPATGLASRLIELASSWPKAEDSSELTRLRRRIVTEEARRGTT